MPLLAPDRQDIWEPVWLLTIGALRLATRDIVVSGVRYDGRITTDLTVSSSLGDRQYGIVAVADTRVTVLGDTGNIMGQTALLERYDDYSGQRWTELGGIVTACPSAGITTELTISDVGLDVLETPIPRQLVNTTTFPLAVDIGKPVPWIFGDPYDVPLPYVREDRVNNQYDYLVGSGSLGLLDLSRMGPNGDKFPVEVDELTFAGGGTNGANQWAVAARTDLYAGFTVVRFIARQEMSDGNLWTILANVHGLQPPARIRRPAYAIRTILTDATQGLAQTADTTTFDVAETAGLTGYPALVIPDVPQLFLEYWNEAREYLDMHGASTWTMDTIARDSSGFGRDGVYNSLTPGTGTLNKKRRIVTPQIGTASLAGDDSDACLDLRLFDGSYVEIPYNAAFDTQTPTVETWFYVPGANSGAGGFRTEFNSGSGLWEWKYGNADGSGKVHPIIEKLVGANAFTGYGLFLQANGASQTTAKLTFFVRANAGTTTYFVDLIINPPGVLNTGTGVVTWGPALHIFAKASGGTLTISAGNSAGSYTPVTAAYVGSISTGSGVVRIGKFGASGAFGDPPNGGMLLKTALYNTALSDSRRDAHRAGEGVRGPLAIDFALVEQVQAQDVIRQLLQLQGGILGRSATGAFTLSLTNTAVPADIRMAVRDGVGPGDRNLVRVPRRVPPPAGTAVQTLRVRYRRDLSGQTIVFGDPSAALLFEQSKSVLAAGIELYIRSDVLRSHAAADRFAYGYGRLLFYTQSTGTVEEVEILQEARKLQRGELVTLEWAPLGFAGETYRALSVDKGLFTVRCVLEPWNDLIVSYVPGSLPFNPLPG